MKLFKILSLVLLSCISVYGQKAPTVNSNGTFINPPTSTIVSGNNLIQFGTGGEDIYGSPQLSIIPSNSHIIIIGDSLQAGDSGNTFCPAYWISKLPGLQSIPTYTFGISGSTAGPTSSTIGSGLYVLANASNYKEFINGSETTGTTSVSSLISGSGNTYIFVNYGANDIRGLSSQTFSTYQSSMTSIYNILHGYGANVKVIGMSLTKQNELNSTYITPSNATFDLWNNWVKAQVSYVQITPTSSNSDLFADVGFFFSGYTSADPWTVDGLHPYENGYKMLGFVMGQAILKNILVPYKLGSDPGAQPFIINAGTAYLPTIFTSASTIGTEIRLNSTDTGGHNFLFDSFGTAAPGWLSISDNTAGGSGGYGVVGVTGGTGSSSGQFQLQSQTTYTWSKDYQTDTSDTGISRDSAGIVDIGNGNFADKSGTLQFTKGILTGNITIGGQIIYSNSTNCVTGSGTALLGTNCPAGTVSAPYKWFKMQSDDGSTVYVPAWK